MKSIKIKETYLLFLIVMGLISLATYSTYALFTASTEILDVVGFEATLTTDSNILEYEMVTVPAGETKIVELTINNNYTSSLYYGAWYEIVSPLDTSNIRIGLYTDENSTSSSGQIASNASLTLLVGIKNNGTEDAIINIGTVGSLTASLGLSSTRTLLSAGWSPIDPDLIINTPAIPVGSYTINPNCINTTAIFNYENWAFRVSSLNTSNTAICSPTITTKTKQYLNTYIKDELTGTTQGNGQVVNENGYRYEGTNPNNYIKFNGELWRIIGVFDSSSHGQTGEYLTKIIRNDILAGYAWDKSNVNIWPTSSLYNLLNTYYYNADDGTESGYCHKYRTTVTGDCDYRTGGINDTYRPMVKNVTWYLGGYTIASTPVNMYTYERSTSDTYYHKANTDYKTTTGYIGLMYASDYGYSVLSSSCVRTTNISLYSTDECAGNSWLFNTGYEWTITHRTSFSYYVFRVNHTGVLDNHFAYNGGTARPVLYLDSSVYILSGEGTKSKPYIIAM